MVTIIRKYLSSQASQAEQKELYNWLQKEVKNKDIFKNEVINYMKKESPDKIYDPEMAFEDFKAAIDTIENRKSLSKNIKRYYKYAAILILLIVGSFFIKQNLNSDALNKEAVVIKAQEQQYNGIVLTQADGTTSKIDDKLEELSYFNKEPEGGPLVYNSISIPKGEIFRLVLSDSTIVWLNSETRLEYPQRFVSNEPRREINLTGEAFFEVAHDSSKPFIVNTDRISVEVLGTKFNVNSYSDNKSIQTTLVQGSVKLVDTANTGNAMILKPSYQGSFDKLNRKLTSKKVDIIEYTSWMSKRIVFNDIPFAELKGKIERTYNVEIINNNQNLDNKRFTGQFDIEDVDVIFKALSASYYFSYEINTNQIIIYK